MTIVLLSWHINESEFIIIIIIIIIITIIINIILLSHHWPFIRGTLETAAIPTVQSSSVRLQYFTFDL
jgi:hypothetical protein